MRQVNLKMSQSQVAGRTGENKKPLENKGFGRCQKWRRFFCGSCDKRLVMSQNHPWETCIPGLSPAQAYSSPWANRRLRRPGIAARGSPSRRLRTMSSPCLVWLASCSAPLRREPAACARFRRFLPRTASCRTPLFGISAGAYCGRLSGSLRLSALSEASLPAGPA